ncbi:MAG: sigma-70 family RNA polymerase sigma factor [Ilumatobacteraceae bacterium]
MTDAAHLPPLVTPAPEATSVPMVPSAPSVNDGYSAVFAAHHLAVFRLAALLAGDEHVAEEVTAEVFARVLPRWRRDEVADPLAYLRRAVANEMRSRWRRRAHERRAVEYRRGEGAHEATDRLELREPLVRALQQLPLQQRTIVVLRYLDDMSEAQVGRTLRLAAGTVKSQASRGLARLRTLLDDQPEERT